MIQYSSEGSAKSYARASRSIAGGVSSNGKAVQEPCPLYLVGGQGSRVEDIDGNHYVDYVLGWGPLLLGHSHRGVLSAVREQLDSGMMSSAQHPLEYELSEKLVRLIPCAEMVTYNTTGSEAVQIALRLARAATGREKVLKFEGHYHGWLDGAYISTDFGPDTPVGERASPTPTLTRGQPRSQLEDVIVIPWNDGDLLSKTLRDQHSSLAAVITEPIMQRGGILPHPGYLELMRSLCDEYGIVMIFDEVVTGFRVGLGGAQSVLRITPDLAVFSKALGGGFPVSCVAGRREIMELIARREVVHAGTYNGHPVALAAANAAVDYLSDRVENPYERLFELSSRLRDGLEAIGRDVGIKIWSQGLGPLWYVYFGEGPVADYRSLIARDATQYRAFARGLVQRGVLTITSQGRWYLSTAHTRDDVDQTLTAARDTLQQVARS